MHTDRISICNSAGGIDPSWPFVLASVLFFVLQYFLSGALERPFADTHVLGSLPALDCLLFGYALAHYFVFDNTRQGLFMAALTAICGPLIEIALINGLGLYHYLHPDIAGVPTWIPWVYFCGSPAVGSLGRRIWSAVRADAR